MATPFVKPTMEELALECKRLNLAPEEAQAFHDHHEARGWKLKTGPMKSWPAALGTWARFQRNGTFSGTPAAKQSTGTGTWSDTISREDRDFLAWRDGRLKAYKYHPKYGLQLREGGRIYCSAASPRGRKGFVAGVLDYYHNQNMEPAPSLAAALEAARDGKMKMSDIFRKMAIGKDMPQAVVVPSVRDPQPYKEATEYVEGEA